jgi:hypothetical protein
MAQIGVEIGLAKSLISPKGNALEFAKRFFVGNNDVSPVPLLELLAANRSYSGLFEFARKYSLSLPSMLEVLGKGYKVRGRLSAPL